MIISIDMQDLFALDAHYAEHVSTENQRPHDDSEFHTQTIRTRLSLEVHVSVRA